METIFLFNLLLAFGEANSTLSNIMDELMKELMQEYDMFTNESSTQNEECNEIVSNSMYCAQDKKINNKKVF